MAELSQKTLRCSDPLPALLRWADGHAHAAFLITSRSEFSGGVGAEKWIEIREEVHGETSQVSKTWKVGKAREATIRIQAGEVFDSLEKFQQESHGKILGFLGYDLKNDLENLNSQNPDILESPEAAFFEPLLELRYSNGVLTLNSVDKNLLAEAEASIYNPDNEEYMNSVVLNLESQTSRAGYLAQARSIQEHLQRGDIYEANYCIQFAGEAENFDPVSQFLNLQQRTEAPHSVFARLNDFYILSASPERYLKNESGRLISQPIKGTIKREENFGADEAQKVKLRHDPKEQNENVMIVDLVRNDLSRIARRGTVHVEKLFGVETFRTVHHLVSTIAAQLDTDKYSAWDALRTTFPMGSMTGAPKISAMKIIDSHENFKRAAYSGAFGWMNPSGDFDFNVLIRSVFYNSKNKKAAFGVGSAITMMADVENEYDECLLKAEALLRTFNHAPADAVS